LNGRIEVFLFETIAYEDIAESPMGSEEVSLLCWMIPRAISRNTCVVNPRTLVSNTGAF
jgi:hypothetical protein